MKAYVRYGASLILAILTMGCDDSASEPATIVRDSAGVRVVEHNTLQEKTAFVLGAPLYRVGWSEAEPQFEQISSAVLLESGRVAVGDAGANRVIVLNAAGEVEAMLGGAGEGPGEIGLLGSVYALADDTLVVEDRGNARMTLYHQGQLIGMHTPEDGRSMLGLMSIGLADRSLIMSVAAYPPYFDEPWLEVPIVRHRLGTEEWDTIGQYDFRSRVSPDETPAPFRAVGLTGAHRRGVLVVRGDRPQVTVLDLEGRTTQIIRWHETPLELTDSIWSVYSAYRMGRQASRSQEEMLDYLNEQRAVADDALPYTSEVRSDGSGRIWVSQFSPDYRYPPAYRVFGHDGEWLGWVSVPPRTEMFDVRGDRAVAVQRDEVDVEAVVLLPVQISR